MDKKRLNKNIEKLLTKGKCLILAYDHGLEHGPRDFTENSSKEFSVYPTSKKSSKKMGYNGKSIDPDYILKIAIEGKYNAVILQKGVAEKYYDKKRDVSLILKLNGKTNLSGGEPVSRQICSVKEAIEIGATAVGYTIYIGSENESVMMEEFGKIEEEAHSLGIPVIGWMYPRGKAVKELTNEKIEYAARVALEIGADFAKVNYTGSIESFKKVVQAAGKCRVLALGGGKKSANEILKEAEEVVKAGACGLAIGRNVWQYKEPLKISKALKEIIFNKKSVEEVKK